MESTIINITVSVPTDSLVRVLKEVFSGFGNSQLTIESADVDLIPASEYAEANDMSTKTVIGHFKKGDLLGKKLGRKFFIHRDQQRARLRLEKK